ncbi:MAG: hypothetical protein KTR15_04950 [Phycisphaeraceae bacterium]|nr:hypothetical protein [Phycisphaeraceae bacterium]
MYAPTIAVAGFFFLGLIGLIVMGLFVGAYLWATGRRPQSSGDMACGSCGYPVRGLNALNCPECGADLREAGIHRPHDGVLHGIGIALTVCCGGILILGCLGSALFLVRDSSSSMQSTPVTSPNPSLQQPTGAQPVLADPPELGTDEPTNHDPPAAEDASP